MLGRRLDERGASAANASCERSALPASRAAGAWNMKNAPGVAITCGCGAVAIALFDSSPECTELGREREARDAPAAAQLSGGMMCANYMRLYEYSLYTSKFEHIGIEHNVHI